MKRLVEGVRERYEFYRRRPSRGFENGNQVLSASRSGRNASQTTCACGKSLQNELRQYQVLEYQYDRLSNPTCNRIFILSQGLDRDPIAGTIQEISLADPCPAYYALSYTWLRSDDVET